MAILYFKGGYFDGGIKSVAQEINAATLRHNRTAPIFEAGWLANSLSNT
jgi:hypothetical protein